MEERYKKETAQMTSDEKKGVIKAINREVANIFTKGTHYKLTLDPKNLMKEYETKHVLAFYNTGVKFGYVTSICRHLSSILELSKMTSRLSSFEH